MRHALIGNDINEAKREQKHGMGNYLYIKLYTTIEIMVGSDLLQGNLIE